MKIINQKAFQNALNQVKAGRVGYIENTDFEIPCITPEPTEGYTKPKDFPNCCDFHKNVFEAAKKQMDDFPNCCEAHKELVNASWFNKSNYLGIPENVINAISYTEFHIIQQIGFDDWYEDIINYIEYCALSFGCLPAGYGPPLGIELYSSNIIHWIRHNKELPQEKKEKLLHYLTDDYGKKPEKAELPDINIHIDAYRKWLKIFPFSISFFKDLKYFYETTIPLFKDKTVYNKYTGIAKNKVLTINELIDALIETTKNLLKKINAAELIKRSLIDEAKKQTLELINRKR